MNKEFLTPPDELLARYLAGETDAEETGAAAAWIAASQENRAYYEGMKRIWDSVEQPETVTFNADAAWQRLQTKMHNPPGEKTETISSMILFRRIAAAVAALIVIGGIVWFASGRTETQPKLMASVWKENADNTDTLPDGTVINLNRNSELTYPEKFTGNTREVTLKGEMFFDVEKDAAHPFIIHAGPISVKVLGTSFNVRAYPNSDSVLVTVKTGKVRCYAEHDSITLIPGDAAVYHTNDHRFRKLSDDNPNLLSYRTRIFHFNNTRLEDAVRILNEAYGCNIVFANDSLRDCVCSGNFRNEPLDYVLSVIGDLDNFTPKKQGNVILLEGPGCK